jgi:hypothetical protein
MGGGGGAACEYTGCEYTGAADACEGLKGGGLCTGAGAAMGRGDGAATGRDGGAITRGRGAGSDVLASETLVPSRDI